MDTICYYSPKTINYTYVLVDNLLFLIVTVFLGARSAELGGLLSCCQFPSNTWFRAQCSFLICNPLPPLHIHPALAMLPSATPGCQWSWTCWVVRSGHVAERHAPSPLRVPLPSSPITSAITWKLPLGLPSLDDILPRGFGLCFHLSVWGYLASFLQYEHWLRPQSQNVNFSSVFY